MEKVTSDVMLNFRVLHRVQTTLHNLKTLIQKRPNAFRGALKYKMYRKLIVKSSSDRSEWQKLCLKFIITVYDGQDSLEFLLWYCGMADSRGSRGSSKSELAIVKNSSRNTFLPPVSFCCGITLGDSTWLSAASDSLGAISRLDVVAEFQGHALFLLCGGTGVAVQGLHVSLSSKCNDV